MVRLCEATITVLYSISLVANAGCPSGLILTVAAYKSSIGTTVSCNSMIGALKSYFPSIEDDVLFFPSFPIPFYSHTTLLYIASLH